MPVRLCSGSPLTFHEHHEIAESQRTAAALGNAHSLVLGEQNYSPPNKPHLATSCE